jgi:hypothetical protein
MVAVRVMDATTSTPPKTTPPLFFLQMILPSFTVKAAHHSQLPGLEKYNTFPLLFNPAHAPSLCSFVWQFERQRCFLQENVKERL